MLKEFMTKIEKWETELRKAGKKFAQIRTYSQFIAKAAILRMDRDSITVQYPVAKVSTKDKIGPLAGSLTPLPWKMVTERIRVDVDTQIREIL